jgi:alkylation response protein AidB-like acyl-CoA dehydrogenase
VQDYVGEAVIDTDASRLAVFSVAGALDRATDDNRRVLSPGTLARARYLHWCWQIKFTAAKNVTAVVDRMLHACGGSGYRRDMELERYLRDGKAGWVMGPSNEVLRQFVGRSVLLGSGAVDYWNRRVDERVLRSETEKLDPAGKRALATRLLAEADQAEGESP